VASPGFGVRGARRPRRRRREPMRQIRRVASGMGSGVPSPADRGSGGASWAPPPGSGAESRPLSHFLHVLGHTTLLVAKKMQIPLWKSGGGSDHHFQKWWWQVSTVTYKVTPMRNLLHGGWSGKHKQYCMATENAVLVKLNFLKEK